VVELWCVVQLKITPPVVISRDDWDTLTMNEKWTNKDNEVDVDIFETVSTLRLSPQPSALASAPLLDFLLINH